MNFEVGDVIEYEGRQYKVVGKDVDTKKHPGGFNKKWDYWLEDVETKNRKKTFIHQLQEAKKV